MPPRGKWKKPQRGMVYDPRGIAPTCDTCAGGGEEKRRLLSMKIPIRLGNIYPSQGQNGDVYSVDGISPTILSGQGVQGRGIGSCNAPKILIEDGEEISGIP